MAGSGKKRCRFLLNTNLPVTAYIAWVSGRRGHPSIGWLRRHGRESCYTKLTVAELRVLESRGKLCPGDAQRIISMLEEYGVEYRIMRRAYLRAARRLARQGVIPRGLVADASLMLYARAYRLHLVSYNVEDYERLSRILGWGYTVPPGEPLGPQDYPQLHLCRDNPRDEAGDKPSSHATPRRGRKTRRAPGAGGRASRQDTTIRANPRRGRSQAKTARGKGRGRKGRVKRRASNPRARGKGRGG